jgi:hypothetical protein
VVVSQSVTVGDTTVTSPASAPLEVASPTPSLDTDGRTVVGVPNAAFRLSYPGLGFVDSYYADLGEPVLDASGRWAPDDVETRLLFLLFPPTLQYTGQVG